MPSLVPFRCHPAADPVDGDQTPERGDQVEVSGRVIAFPDAPAPKPLSGLGQGTGEATGEMLQVMAGVRVECEEPNRHLEPGVCSRRDLAHGVGEAVQPAALSAGQMNPVPPLWS